MNRQIGTRVVAAAGSDARQGVVVSRMIAHSPAWSRVRMFAVIVVLFSGGVGLAAAARLPALAGTSTLSIALCITATGLGARHAFDVDHIAAIDATTRAFLARGQRTESIGFWFALGHSTIVVSAVVLLCLGFSAFTAQLGDENSTLYVFAGVWGPAVAGVFLLVVAALNVGPLRRAYFAVRGRDGGESVGMSPDDLPSRGVFARILRPVLRRVTRSWQMYGVGFLFGLGFDTASTVGLIALGSVAVVGAPGWSVLALPLLFAAGMTLCDTLDGMLMQHAYAWSERGHSRRAGYDLTITLISVVVAVAVGVLSLLDAAHTALAGRATALDWLEEVELSAAGPVVVALLLSIWGGAVVLRRVTGAGS